MQECGLKEGVFCTNFCISQESNRIVETDHKLSNVQRSRESMRKGFSDEEKEKEGLLSTWNEWSSSTFVNYAFINFICIVNFNSNFLKTLRFISSANFVLVTQTFQGMLIATISVHWCRIFWVGEIFLDIWQKFGPKIWANLGKFCFWP